MKLASEMANLQDLPGAGGFLNTSRADQADKERDDALAKADSYDELLAAVDLYVNGDQTAADAVGKLKRGRF